MLVSEFAMMDPGPTGDSLLMKCSRLVARFFGFGEEPARTPRHTDIRVNPPIRMAEPQPAAPIQLAESRQPESTTPDFRWRRHQQLLNRPASTLPDEERHARHHAVRALYAAREGALACAEEHFTRAASCDNVDLAEVPGFWSLPRAAMMTAVRAYEANDRLRDASALNARIRTHLRPREISPLPDNVTELPPRRRLTMSGNS